MNHTVVCLPNEGPVQSKCPVCNPKEKKVNSPLALKQMIDKTKCTSLLFPVVLKNNVCECLSPLAWRLIIVFTPSPSNFHVLLV